MNNITIDELRELDRIRSQPPVIVSSGFTPETLAQELADAKAVREQALANAKQALEEALARE